MKNILNRQFWLMLLFTAAGFYLAWCYYRPAVPISIVKMQPQMLADRWIYVEGRVERVFGVAGVLKSFELSDTLDGARIMVKTDRTILPACGAHLRIRVKLNEPVPRLVYLEERQHGWWNLLAVPGKW